MSDKDHFPNLYREYPGLDGAYSHLYFFTLADAFEDRYWIEHFHEFISSLTDYDSNRIPNDTDFSAWDIKSYFIDFNKLQNNLKKLFKIVMQHYAEEAYKKMVKYAPPAKDKWSWIFGLPELELGEDIWKKMKEHAKKAGVNAIGMVAGNYAGKAIKESAKAARRGLPTPQLLEQMARDEARGIGLDLAMGETTKAVEGEVVQGIVKNGVDETNLLQYIADPSVLSESGKKAFNAVDTVTDYVPIVGNVKAFANLGYNLICVGIGLFSYFSVKKTEEEINKKIRENNLKIYAAIREDFKSFTHYPDRFAEYMHTGIHVHKVRHPRFKDYKIYKNSASFSNYFTSWAKEKYEVYERAYSKIEKAKQAADAVRKEIEKYSKELKAHIDKGPPSKLSWNYDELEAAYNREYNRLNDKLVDLKRSEVFSRYSELLYDCRKSLSAIMSIKKFTDEFLY